MAKHSDAFDPNTVLNQGVIARTAPTRGRRRVAAEKTLLITGLARSGTSMLAALLQAAGVWLGDYVYEPINEDAEIAQILRARDFYSPRRADRATERQDAGLGLQDARPAPVPPARRDDALPQSASDRDLPRSGRDRRAQRAVGAGGRHSGDHRGDIGDALADAIRPRLAPALPVPELREGTGVPARVRRQRAATTAASRSTMRSASNCCGTSSPTAPSMCSRRTAPSRATWKACWTAGCMAGRGTSAISRR